MYRPSADVIAPGLGSCEAHRTVAPECQSPDLPFVCPLGSFDAVQLSLRRDCGRPFADADPPVQVLGQLLPDPEGCMLLINADVTRANRLVRGWRIPELYEFEFCLCQDEETRTLLLHQQGKKPPLSWTMGSATGPGRL